MTIFGVYDKIIIERRIPCIREDKMKKTRILSFILSIVMLLAVCIPFSVSARVYETNPLYKNEAGNITVPKGTPVIDGSIGDGEGWSLPKAINGSNLAGDASTFNRNNVSDITANVYFAQDETGLYLAADVNDFTLNPTDGPNEEYMKVSGESYDAYGINGDDFIFCYDPLHAMIYNGFDHSDYSAWYNISFEEASGGYKLIVYRTFLDDGDITEQIEGKVTVNETNWTFEVKFPWSVLVPDAKSASFGQFDGDYTDIIANGAESGAHFQYLDRVFNEELGIVDSLNRFATVIHFKHGGAVGPKSDTTNINSYGINLISADTEWTNIFTDVADNAWYTKAVKFVNAKGLMSGTGPNTFSGSVALSRGMFITILARMAEISPYYYLTSTPVDARNKYYTPYIEWAYRNGIIKAENKGGQEYVYPDASLTREEVAMILYNFGIWFSNDSVSRLNKISSGVDFSGVVTWTAHDTSVLDVFTDKNKITPGYEGAMGYAVGEGVFSGSNGKINPTGNITRFETAQVMYTIANVYLRNQYDNLSRQVMDINNITHN